MDKEKQPRPNKSWVDKAFNTAILQKNRMAWVDYLRGIAIILVVYRHALLGLERSHTPVPGTLSDANMIFYSFRMPLFFILSGIFINGSIARKPFNKLVYNKFENLLYPYLIWATIQITLQICLARFSNAYRTIQDYTFIFYDPRTLDQFWYLPALFNTTIIYLVIKVKLRAPAWSQLFIGLGFYLLAPLIPNISMLSDWMLFYIFFALGDIMSTLFFKERTQRFLKSPLTLLAIIPVFIVTEMHYLHRMNGGGVGPFEFIPIALIGCFSMFVLAFRLQSWNILRFLRILGFHSLFIYVMHVMITAFTRSILVIYFGIHSPELLLLACILAGVIIPVVVYNLLIKDNVLWFLFSLKRPARNAPVPNTTDPNERPAPAPVASVPHSEARHPPEPRHSDRHKA